MAEKMEMYDVHGKTVYVKEEDMWKAMQEAKEQAYYHCIHGNWNCTVYIDVDVDGNVHVGFLGQNTYNAYDENRIRVYQIVTFPLDEDNEYITCAEEMELTPVDDDEVRYFGRPERGV